MHGIEKNTIQSNLFSESVQQEVKFSSWQELLESLGALRALLEQDSKYFILKITFKIPVTISKLSKKEKKVFTIGFKQSEKNGAYFIATRCNARYLYYLSLLPNINHLGSYEIVNSDEKKDDQFYIEEARKVNSKIHPNAWYHFKYRNEEFIAGKEERPYYLTEKKNGAYYRSIKNIFNAGTLNNIKAAFDEKKDYSASIYGVKRITRVEVKRVESEGETYVNAWFSTEAKYGGSEANYLLINPTTALFMEYD